MKYSITNTLWDLWLSNILDMAVSYTAGTTGKVNLNINTHTRTYTTKE